MHRTPEAEPKTEQRERVSVGERIGIHIRLTKPRIIELLLVTAIPTMFLAADGFPDPITACAVVLGGALAGAGANTFNSIYDRDHDALMNRTNQRPAVLGQVTARAGMFQGTILSLASALTLFVLANALSALLALSAIAMYAVGYTMILKRRTSQNIVWGGAAGCMPVLIAWSATTGSLTWTPIILFMIIFFWTPPHYWPLAMKYRDDYERAGIPMLPVVRTNQVVVRSIIAYTWVMIVMTIALAPIAQLSWFYLSAAVLLGAAFLYLVYALHSGIRHGNSEADVNRLALRVFHGSITYLTVLFLVIAIAPFIN